jgi:hypothetical protein
MSFSCEVKIFSTQEVGCISHSFSHLTVNLTFSRCTVATYEALTTESWQYNHSIQVGGNTTYIKPVQRLRWHSHHRTSFPSATSRLAGQILLSRFKEVQPLMEWNHNRPLGLIPGEYDDKKSFFIIIIISGVGLSPLVLRPLLAYCTSPGW